MERVNSVIKSMKVLGVPYLSPTATADQRNISVAAIAVCIALQGGGMSLSV